LDKVKQWNKFSKFSGGTLVEKCCHYFDLLNMFSQSRPVSVFATGSQAVNFLEFEYNGEKSDILDNAIVSVVYENGVRASFNLCMFALCSMKRSRFAATKAISKPTSAKIF
jgi:myo-inositol 2-dehydrogenase/D-chiro-inositol 1-dehydrogenase